MKKITSILLALIMLITINTYATGKEDYGKIIVSVNQTINMAANGSQQVPVTINVNNMKGREVTNLTLKASIKDPEKVYIAGDGYLYNGSDKVFDAR